MYEEDEEVDAVEERYDVVEPAQRTPGETHDPITEGTRTGTEMGRRGGGGRKGKERKGTREWTGIRRLARLSAFLILANIPREGNPTPHTAPNIKDEKEREPTRCS